MIVVLRPRADLATAPGTQTTLARRRAVVDNLRATAAQSQHEARALLDAAGVPYRPFWLVNAIHVRAGDDVLESLLRLPSVERIDRNPRVRERLEPPRPELPGAPLGGAEPNIEHTGAPGVFWAAGFRGEGVVVGVADSGQEWTHPALMRQYRGWDGETVSHDFNWHDAIHTGGGSCGADARSPCDDNGHGTGTAGLVVGDDDGGNQIGMAPGARWIGCRNMDQGVGTPATYIECFEFFLAPTDLDGENPTPELAADVINNSWRCPPSEGCTDPNVLREAVENLTAAGIVVVASAGNDGSSCGTVDAPPAIYDAAWTVGSINIFGEVSSFSSRGPVEVDGSGRRKPDLMAPGEDVRSSEPNGSYGSASGTSYSGPHVAGMAALLISSQPCLRGRLDAMKTHLESHAVGFEVEQDCGGLPGDVLPNNVYGWGWIQSALPGAELCEDLGLAGSVAGVSGDAAACIDRTTGESVTIPLAGATDWDCRTAGLDPAGGDDVAQVVRGTATGSPVGGEVAGMSVTTAQCRNRTTGQSVTPTVVGRAWSCTSAGFVAAPGDAVVQVVRGSSD